MTEFLLEINDSADTLEINDSGGSLLILADSIQVVTPSEKPVSHVTIGAGGDLREELRRRRKQAKKQILEMRVEIPTFGTSLLSETISLKAKGTAKKTDILPAPTTGTASVTNRIAVPASGVAKAVQRNVIRVQGKKGVVSGTVSEITKNMREEVKRLKKISVLQEALRQLDEDD